MKVKIKKKKKLYMNFIIAGLPNKWKFEFKISGKFLGKG